MVAHEPRPRQGLEWSDYGEVLRVRFPGRRRGGREDFPAVRTEAQVEFGCQYPLLARSCRR